MSRWDVAQWSLFRLYSENQQQKEDLNTIDSSMYNSYTTFIAISDINYDDINGCTLIISTWISGWSYWLLSCKHILKAITVNLISLDHVWLAIIALIWICQNIGSLPCKYNITTLERDELPALHWMVVALYSRGILAKSKYWSPVRPPECDEIFMKLAVSSRVSFISQCIFSFSEFEQVKMALPPG